ncbi:helix-turn-helix domain-containing protein [Calderihabitans maritimus]|uniref:XRE family transcriptional regulator n=1 Tax=Calderihabitans maritimus TaxID=1246530 RepID=A0A1Z5HNQ8_9FIRM|nr:helix-turn-helix transcriptional regulator [Calderihabitans maritimus]GAW90935.1 XRE family transcriptional regulator [Calderihabitans maritimus]
MKNSSFIGQKIRVLREKNKLTRTELAKQLGITGLHLYRIETGRRNPTIKMLQKLAKIFQVPLSYFSGEEPSGQSVKYEVVDLEQFLRENTVRLEGRELSPDQKEKVLTLIKTALDLSSKNDKS